MFTLLDLSGFVFSLVNVPEVKAALSGGVYNSFRPTTSVKTDVVVNAVSLTDGTLQIGTANVNVFAPDVVDQAGNSRIDFSTLKRIQNVVLPLVEEAYFDDGNVWVESTNFFPTEDNKQHFLNLRLSARLYNKP